MRPKGGYGKRSIYSGLLIYLCLLLIFAVDLPIFTLDLPIFTLDLPIFIVDLPIKNGYFPQLQVKSPEGKTRTSPWDGKDHPEMVGAHNCSCGESIYLSI